MANPYGTYLERFLASTGHAAAPTLEDAINYIRSGASQAEKGKPEMLAAGHKAAREGLHNVFMVDIGGGKLVNLAPNAPRLHVKTPDGRILQFPKSAKEEAEKAGTVMNFTPKQLEEALPPPPAPAPTKDTNAAVARAIEQAAQGVEAERTSIKTAAQKAEEAKAQAAALERDRLEAKAQGFQDARNTLEGEARAGLAPPPAAQAPAGRPAAPDPVGSNPFVELQAGASEIPAAVQVARGTVSGARAAPASGVEAPASAMPWGAAPSGSRNLPPGSRVLQPTTAEEAMRLADVERRGANAIQLGIAAPFAVAAGAKTFTPERIDRFRTWMNTPSQQGGASAAGSAVDGGGSSEGNYSPRRDLGPMMSTSVGYSPVTDAAKDILRQRLNSDAVDSSYAPDFDSFQNWTKSVAAQRPTDPAEFSRLDYMHPVGAGRGYMTEEAGARSAANAARAASTPRPSTSPPQPMRRLGADAPTTDQGNQSFFSSIMDRLRPQDPYAGMSARQMYERAQEMQSSGDEGGANLLIQRAGQAPDAGMNRGGTAKPAGPHKDAALHKALDIIHAMMSRGR